MTTNLPAELTDPDELAAVLDERHGYYFEELRVGMTDVYTKTITDADIVIFAGVSGDTNPMHLDESFARNTPFESRIVHGKLTASFISTVLGTKLPGPGCIYLSQSLKFLAPVRIGDTVSARVTCTELLPEKRRARFKTVCAVEGTVVIDGDALVQVPARPEVVPRAAPVPAPADETPAP